MLPKYLRGKGIPVHLAHETQNKGECRWEVNTKLASGAICMLIDDYLPVYDNTICMKVD